MSEFGGGAGGSSQPIPKRDRTPALFKSLALVLASLQGEHIVVELRNDSEVSGVLEETDANLNLIVHGARQVTADGAVTDMDVASINGSSVRYVHIAKELHLHARTAAFVRTIEHRMQRRPKIVNRKPRSSLAGADAASIGAEGDEEDEGVSGVRSSSSVKHPLGESLASAAIVLPMKRRRLDEELEPEQEPEQERDQGGEGGEADDTDTADDVPPVSFRDGGSGRGGSLVHFEGEGEGEDEDAEEDDDSAGR